MIANPLFPWLCGAASALAVSAFAFLVGFDRDRSFYPVVMIVIALLYDLFAVMGGSMDSLKAEIFPSLLFVTAAVDGYRYSLWIVAAALAAHGLFDYAHGGLIDNPGVPAWWPAWCGTYDVVAAACLGLIILSRRGSKAGQAADESPLPR